MSPDQVIDIIIKNTEGYDNVSREVVVTLVLKHIADGHAHIFNYGKVVFLVSAHDEYPAVHLYSMDGGSGLFEAGRKFMREVWDVVECDKLIAPIANDKVKKFAERFGWKPSDMMHVTGHQVFWIERP